jgi:hypothetical protein
MLVVRGTRLDRLFSGKLKLHQVQRRLDSTGVRDVHKKYEVKKEINKTKGPENAKRKRTG